MRLHDRYLLRELAAPSIVSLASVLLMMTVGQLFLLLDPRHNGMLPSQLPLPDIGRYLLFRLPMMLQKSLPVALLLGSSLAISRLSHESELTAIRMGGLTLPRFLAPLVALGAVLAIVSFVLGERVTPSSDHQAEAILRKLTFDTEIAGLQNDTLFRSEDRLVYFRDSTALAPGRMLLGGVMIYELPHSRGVAGAPGGTATRFWTSEHAEVVGGVWTLYGVIEHQVSAGGEITRDLPMGTTKIDLHRNIQYFLANREKPTELTASDLAERIRVDERLAVAPAVLLPLRYEYGFRFALPFACLVFAIVAAPLAVRFARGGSLVGILVAFGVLFFFYDVMVIAEKLALNGALPAELAAWLPNLLFGGFGAWLASQEP